VVQAPPLRVISFIVVRKNLLADIESKVTLLVDTEKIMIC